MDPDPNSMSLDPQQGLPGLLVPCLVHFALKKLKSRGQCSDPSRFCQLKQEKKKKITR